MADKPQPHNRRQWMATSARWLALGGLTVGAAVLGVRSATTGEDCGRAGPCCDCEKLNVCRRTPTKPK